MPFFNGSLLLQCGSFSLSFGGVVLVVVHDIKLLAISGSGLTFVREDSFYFIFFADNLPYGLLKAQNDTACCHIC